MQPLPRRRAFFFGNQKPITENILNISKEFLNTTSRIDLKSGIGMKRAGHQNTR
jgi:hypothetical protein